MLRSIRDNAGDNQTIYLFADQAAYHKEKQTVIPEMDKLNMQLVLNTQYKYEFNPVERLWSMYKSKFRALLLDKMLQNPEPKATPLVDAMFETFTMTDVSKAVPRFIRKALHILRREANTIRR